MIRLELSEEQSAQVVRCCLFAVSLKNGGRAIRQHVRKYHQARVVTQTGRVSEVAGCVGRRLVSRDKVRTAFRSQEGLQPETCGVERRAIPAVKGALYYLG